MTSSITFMPFVGEPNNMPFKVKCKGDEIFREVIIRAIKTLAKKDEELLDYSFDIATGSADIMVDTKYLEMRVDDVIKQYGGVFSLKNGKNIKGPF